jgi:hypothetical protein
MRELRERDFNSRGVLWPCFDCGHEVAPVIKGMRNTWGVHDKVWKKAGMKAQGRRPLGTGEFLCAACLSGRLGRDLTFADFCYTTWMPVSQKTWRRWLASAHR